MNYRHAFHAGNAADVLKHVVLSRILAYLIGKPAPLRYIDTHAGLGRYDLDAPEPARTGEWRGGIGRLDGASLPAPLQALLAPYLDAVGSRLPDGRPQSYPGSPAVAQSILRPADRLLLCELHPADALTLADATKRDRRVKVLAVDGYQGLKGAVPPPERRGLVLIDPPFESRTEFTDMASALADALRRWPTGVYALWYPIKDTAAVLSFLRDIRSLGVPKLLEIELSCDTRPGLRGSGLVVVNPPYTLADDLAVLLPYLAERFGDENGPWRWRLDGLVR